MSLTKTIQTPLLALKDIAANETFKSNEVDVSAISDAAILWDFAPVANTATPAATELAIQGSRKATGDSDWVNIQAWLSPSVVPDVLTQNAGGAINTNTIGLASGSVASGTYFYLKEGTDSGEFHKSLGTAATTVTTEDNFAASHSGKTLYSKGVERFKFDVDLRNVTRLRVVINNNRGTNRNIVSAIALITSAAA